VGQITKEKQNFQRVVVSREEALSMFQENKFKVEIISGLPAEATISLYRSGSIAHLVLGTQTSLGTSPKAMHKSPNTLHKIVICEMHRCGPMVDLCHGPHLPNTGYLKTCAVNAFNRAFWRADVNKEPLQVGTFHIILLQTPAIHLLMTMPEGKVICWQNVI
jgi:threonyl-tRNA synthetase